MLCMYTSGIQAHYCSPKMTMKLHVIQVYPKPLGVTVGDSVPCTSRYMQPFTIYIQRLTTNSICMHKVKPLEDTGL